MENEKRLLMKITDTELAEYYDVPVRTLADWKVTRGKRYTAMKWAYMVVKHYKQVDEVKEALNELKG